MRPVVRRRFIMRHILRAWSCNETRSQNVVVIRHVVRT